MNRIVNRCVQWMFCRVQRFDQRLQGLSHRGRPGLRPLRPVTSISRWRCPLGALNRHYNIAKIPIAWSGHLGYLESAGHRDGAPIPQHAPDDVFSPHLIADDLSAERLMSRNSRFRYLDDLECRLKGDRCHLGIDAGQGELAERIPRLSAPADPPRLGNSQG